MTFKKFFEQFIQERCDSELQKTGRTCSTNKPQKFTASVLAKRLGVKASAIKELLQPCEHHYVTKSFDVDYYSEDDAKEKLDELIMWSDPLPLDNF